MSNNEVLQSANPTRSRLLHLYENIPQSTPSTSNNAESTHQDNQPNDNVTPPILDNIENACQDSQPNNNPHSVK
ncbi:8603_t:CDS:1, partial [Gigaspora margarita]